ncbi:SIS domain-containing protein [Psychromarinibacter sp. S121]|uniref:SIS domain-containing protein n=1 Tax=Psychromarinibacter sp. S121 TaxID=3415127 RepID=UPI003C7A6E6C
MSYRSTVARQPAALRDTCTAITAEIAGKDLAALDKPVIGITGIGASYAAAVVGAGEFQRQGRRAIAIRACDIDAGQNLADALVGLSHRGRSVETVQAFRERPTATRFAITKDDESPLAEASDIHLKLNNGDDATPSSTGYTATLLALGMAIEKATGAPATDWAGIPAIAEETLALAAAKMDRLGKMFENRRAIDCVGAGSAFGTADEASLLIREASRIPAAAYDTRHYLHGPMESMDATTGVVVFGAEREIALAQNLKEIGCPVLLVTTADGIEDDGVLTVIKVPFSENRVAQGIIDIFVPQLLAATLSDAAGLTDTKFRYRQSDTKIGQPAAA